MRNRNFRAFVLAIMMAGALAIAPASADTGTLSGGRDKCTFLNGRWLKFLATANYTVVAVIESLAERWDCELVEPPPVE